MNRCKRILHIEIRGGLGGIETFLLNVYRKIDRSKVQFDFVSSVDNVAIAKELEDLGANIYYIPYSNILNYCIKLRDLIQKNQYEIVHIHKNSAANIFPLIVCKSIGVKKVIVHSHNTAPSRGSFSKALHYINRPILRKLADQKFACSVIAAEWLYGKKYVRKNPIRIINNGVDINCFKYDLEKRNKVRAELGLNSDTFVIGNVGRLVPQKNQMFLLQIMEKMKNKINNVKLVICGDGPLKDSLIEYCRMHDLMNDVIFTGRITNANEMIQAFDVALIPSIYEGLCISAVEAQCAGLPTIVSNKLPNETRLISTYSELPIDQGVDLWIEKCLEYQSYERKDETETIIKKKYSIEQTAKTLEKYYCNVR